MKDHKTTMVDDFVEEVRKWVTQLIADGCTGVRITCGGRDIVLDVRDAAP